MNLKKILKSPYNVLTIIFSFSLIFAFFIDTPINILIGLRKIVLSPDLLITDYVEVGGISATLVNSSITTLLTIFALRKLKLYINGSTIMALWLLAGFSFFGKNLYNIWPIMFGGFLFSVQQKEPFSKYCLVTILSTTLAPVVSQLSFTGQIPQPYGVIMGILAGIFVGFIMSPISANAMKVHGGYNLYNVGFAAGIVGSVVMAILKSFNFIVKPITIWSTADNFPLVILSSIIFAFLIFVGVYCGRDNYSNMKAITTNSGRLVNDYYFKYKETAYINMGVLGFFALFLVIFLLKAPVNGPVLGGIYTIVGFGCFGKNMKNIIPIILGCALGVLLSRWQLNEPAIILGMLFGTCLAPIAGTFGISMGLLAGYMHINVVMNVGILHGGLNLYNNGLSGGFVAMILVPLIIAFRRSEFNET